MATATQQQLLGLLDFVHGRLNGRVEGMPDEEYLWEPVSGCWSVRPDEDGVFRAESTYPDPEPAPFTTIAWRLWHIGNLCLQGYNDNFFDDVKRDRSAWPATTADAMTELNREWARFRAHVAAMDDEALTKLLGPAAGPYAEDSYHSLVLHALDEVIHHTAEIALLRDLYRHRAADGGLPAVSAV